jgi:hypothetical protein
LSPNIASLGISGPELGDFGVKERQGCENI